VTPRPDPSTKVEDAHHPSPNRICPTQPHRGARLPGRCRPGRQRHGTVDVGGANGSLLHLLLEANPSLRGIVLDRPNIVEEAAAETAKRGLTDRADVIGGNFFESVPAADL
jgi:hypothetical protein